MKNTKENAIITLINNQTSDGKTEKIEMTASGGFYEKNGTFFITYEEHREMGMGNSRVVLKIEPHSVTMRRMGDFQTVMSYRVGEVTEFIYRVPFGDLSFKINTTSIQNKLLKSGGELFISYQLFAGNDFTVNEIYLNVKPEEKYDEKN